LRGIEVVHNGADATSFAPKPKVEARRKLGLPTTGALVCFVGFLREEKAVEYLLEGFAQLRRPDAKLCLVGDGPLKESLVAQSRKLGIGDACIFAGNRPHDEIPFWLSAADCLVLCSLSEGLPTVLPEAMLCRVPIVATPVGGVPEIIHDGETGLLVACKDSGAIARALQSLLSTPELSADLTQKAEALAKTSLTWEMNARRTSAVYEDAIREHGLRRGAHPVADPRSSRMAA
jgi:glycosyltransferase involved in cell wall biosynthesis